MQKGILIAIDGFSSCGKSTLARQLAAALGYHYIDSGAMYRAITLYIIRAYINLADHAQIMDALANIELSFVFNDETRQSDIHLNNENVAHQVRDMTVAEKVSEVATIKEVRSFAVAQQKRLGKKKSIVMDGRDIGTTVFPDAELKIFMTADAGVRVLRRYDELLATDASIILEDVKHNLELRDYIDSNREISPLRKAEDALELDNTHMTKEEQLATVLKWVNEKLNKMN